jgi:hypothetical protein
MKKSIVFLVLLVAISLLAVFMPAGARPNCYGGHQLRGRCVDACSYGLSIIDDSRPCLFLLEV